MNDEQVAKMAADLSGALKTHGPRAEVLAQRISKTISGTPNIVVLIAIALILRALEKSTGDTGFTMPTTHVLFDFFDRHTDPNSPSEMVH